MVYINEEECGMIGKFVGKIVVIMGGMSGIGFEMV